MEAMRHPPGAHSAQESVLSRATTPQLPRPAAFARAAPTASAFQLETNARPKSEGHRHKEAVDAGLPVRPVIPVEDPVVSVLAGQRLTDGDAPDVAVDRARDARDPMLLLRTKMMGVRWPAARSLHPVGNGFPVRPVVMSVRAASGQSKQEYGDSSNHLSPLCGFPSWNDAESLGVFLPSTQVHAEPNLPEQISCRRHDSLM